MNFGFFPITADPVHIGHIEGALRAARVLKLSRVFFQVGADVQNKTPIASREQRFAMVEIAIQRHLPVLGLSKIDTEHSMQGEDAFAVFLRTDLAKNATQIYYIAGADNEFIVSKNLTARSQSIARSFELAILARTGSNRKLYLGTKYIDFHLDASSSIIRNEKRFELLPPGVEEYCRIHRLYGIDTVS